MADSPKATDVSHDEVSSAPRAGFKGHMKKRRCGLAHWIWYLMCTLVLIAVIIIIIFAAALPRVVQNKMDGVEISMDGMKVTEPRPQTYMLSINSTVRSESGTSATVSAFQGRMYLTDLQPRGEPFAIVDFPESETKEVSTVNITALKRVNDLPAFTAFSTWLQNNESLRISIEGEPSVKVKGIAWSYTVNFRKTITIKGLNGFKGQTVSDATILKELSPSGDNFNGIVHIPNPSVLTIEVGNCSFRNFLPDGTEIGTVYIDNLVLPPGGVAVPMRANVTQAPILTTILKKPYCETGIIPFSLVGKDVFYDGVRVPYYADGLATLNSTVDINIGKAIEEAFRFPIKCS